MIRNHNKHLEKVCDFGYIVGCILYVLLYTVAGCAFGLLIAWLVNLFA